MRAKLLEVFSEFEEKQSRQRYTAEFKEHAVKRVLSGHGVTAVARELAQVIADSQLTGPSSPVRWSG